MFRSRSLQFPNAPSTQNINPTLASECASSDHVNHLHPESQRTPDPVEHCQSDESTLWHPLHGVKAWRISKISIEFLFYESQNSRGPSARTGALIKIRPVEQIGILGILEVQANCEGILHRIIPSPALLLTIHLHARIHHKTNLHIPAPRKPCLRASN